VVDSILVHAADGRVFDEHLAEFFAWKDGRIVEVTQYSRKP
jgi:ketosteroid isomerase-like protein